MIHIYQSCSLDTLYQHLTTQLTDVYASHSLSLFERLNILVQSPAMEKWLQVKLAHELGVIANLSFPMPASFIWSLYGQCVDADTLERTNAFTKPSMSWQLMQLLDEQLALEESTLPDFVASYVSRLHAQHSSSQAQLMQFQFCQTMADVYDQYLVFRPDWLRHWEANTPTDIHSPNESWQAELWRLLIARQTDPKRASHRVQLNDQTLAALRHSTPPECVSVQPLFVFGLSSLPPQHLHMLQALSQHIDVHVFVQTPSAHYFSDLQSTRKQAWIQSHTSLASESATNDDNHVDWSDLHFCEGNPLVASMSGPIKQLAEQLNEMEQHNWVLDDNEFEEPDLAQESVLKYTQYEIRQLTFAGQMDSWFDQPISRADATHEHGHVIADNDHSLQIHACHSRVRELEVLHNQLLRCFALDDSLRPDDVLIMTPDPSLYAQHIGHVFGVNPNESGYLPMAVSDTNLLSDSPLVENFINLINIGKHRFKASHIVQLLQQPTVHERWGFDDSDRDLITQWIDTLGVHWAWDAEDKAQYDVPTSSKFTWSNAMQRSVLGLMMETETTPFQNQLAHPAITPSTEGLWGRWFDFLHALNALRQRLSKPKPIAQWTQLFVELLNTFFDADNMQYHRHHDQFALQQLQHILSDITQSAELNTYNTPVSLELIQSLLNERLSKPTQSFQLMSGKINLTSLLPMRGIPFKVICLIGMNDGEYPAPDTRVEFNLMNHTPSQIGDRSRREEDAHQFLQAIVSAQDCLHISYIGRNIKDNSPLNPSSFIQELIHYLDHSCHGGHHAVFQEHALHAFNPQYFTSSDIQSRAPMNFKQRDFLCASVLHPSNSADASNTQLKRSHDWNALPQAAQSDTANTSAETPNPPRHIELSRLIAFYKNNSKHTLRTHNVLLDITSSHIDDDEPLAFELGLHKAQYFKEAVQAILNGTPDDEWHDMMALQADTPDTQHAVVSINTLNTLAKDAVANSDLISPTPPVIEQHTIALDHTALHAQLPVHSGSHLIAFKASNVKPRDHINLWLMHLTACCVLPNATSRLVYVESNNSKFIAFDALDATTAKGLLNQYVDTFLRAQHEYVPFDVSLSFAYATSYARDQDADNAANAALKAHHLSPELATSFCVSESIIRSTEFHDTALSLLAPLIERLPKKTSRGAKS
ncbi:MAG: exodeoxyribonuclease V subunit gamma [Pseudomonadota bacterium]